MPPDEAMKTYPAVCPICHKSIDVPASVVSEDGSYSFECKHCQQPISGTLAAPAPQQQ